MGEVVVAERITPAGAVWQAAAAPEVVVQAVQE
jgi:hypothetical protein